MNHHGSHCGCEEQEHCCEDENNDDNDDDDDEGRGVGAEEEAGA